MLVVTPIQEIVICPLAPTTQLQLALQLGKHALLIVIVATLIKEIVIRPERCHTLAPTTQQLAQQLGKLALLTAIAVTPIREIVI